IGKELAHLDAYRAVFVDGLFRADLSTVQDAAETAFQTLRAGLEDEAGAAHALAHQPPLVRDVIADLATAFATDGAILSILPKARLEKPIHLIFIACAGTPKLAAAQSAIVIGEGAEATLIETHSAVGEAQALSCIRLAIGRDARLSHIRVNAGAKQLSSASVALSERTQYHPLQMTIDGALTRAQTHIRFGGPGARCHYA